MMSVEHEGRRMMSVEHEGRRTGVDMGWNGCAMEAVMVGGGCGGAANIPESLVLGTKVHELRVGVAMMVVSCGRLGGAELCGRRRRSW